MERTVAGGRPRGRSSAGHRGAGCRRAGRAARALAERGAERARASGGPRHRGGVAIRGRPAPSARAGPGPVAGGAGPRPPPDARVGRPGRHRARRRPSGPGTRSRLRTVRYGCTVWRYRHAGRGADAPATPRFDRRRPEGAPAVSTVDRRHRGAAARAPPPALWRRALARLVPGQSPGANARGVQCSGAGGRQLLAAPGSPPASAVGQAWDAGGDPAPGRTFGWPVDRHHGTAAPRQTRSPRPAWTTRRYGVGSAGAGATER
jgi:hypothetical protein